MMNLSFIDVNCNREYNKKVEKLYNSAFPKEERIPIFFLKLLARKNKAKFYGINDDKKFIGLVYNVYYKDIILIYYFAIDEELRGQGTRISRNDKRLFGHIMSNTILNKNSFEKLLK